ncbi:MAG TPA: nucleotide exchange factor GrpE [Planctomycetota bacterium]|nr:nucleotide exchange factor GrpE [Planctomycetota bacterium]
MPDDPTDDAPDAEDAEEAAQGAASAETAALKASLAALEEKLRRQQAEFMNDIQRVRRQAEEDRRFAVQPVVTDLLGVADALHNGIEGLKATDHEQRMAEGLRLVERQLLEALAKYGVVRMDAVGKPFDPTVHEAILEVEGTTPGRVVVQVLRPGFTLHGRVVRPAHVIVSRPKAAHPENPAPDAPDAGAPPT